MINNTKIVATLGPASSDYKTILGLAEAGVNVFRLNFSHGTPEDHAERVKCIRKAQETLKRPIGILADLQGPKLRVGTFKDGSVTLEEGKHFRLDLDKTPGDINRVNLPHTEIIEVARPGHILLLDDGKLSLRVVEQKADALETEVVVGGRLSERKGVNVPDVALPIPALTEKDRADLQTALSLNVDFIALSFVQKGEDVVEARELIGDKAWIVSKIEKPQALECLEEIVELSDAIMVARGDLAVEIGAARVPSWQNRIVEVAQSFERPVIIATQMLESMIEAPVPTRAEVTDVANAVFQGADAVMLSAESAAGKYPIKAVSMMSSIIEDAEENPEYLQYEPAAAGDDSWAATGFEEEDFVDGQPTDSIVEWIADEYHNGNEDEARAGLVDFYEKRMRKQALGSVLTAATSLVVESESVAMVFADMDGEASLDVASRRAASSIVFAPKNLIGKLALIWGIFPEVADDAKALIQDMNALEKRALEFKEDGITFVGISGNCEQKMLRDIRLF